MTYSKIIQDFRECHCKIPPGMRRCHLEQVEQETHRLPFLFEVDCYGDIRLVVR